MEIRNSHCEGGGGTVAPLEVRRAFETGEMT
jgi:hypothetical protein